MENAPNEPNRSGGALRILWLFCAFIPALIGIGPLDAQNLPDWVGPALLVFSGACCLVSAFGVLGGVKNMALRVIFGILLAVFFFILNAIIVVFVGCSGMGRISP